MRVWCRSGGAWITHTHSRDRENTHSHTYTHTHYYLEPQVVLCRHTKVNTVETVGILELY